MHKELDPSTVVRTSDFIGFSGLRVVIRELPNDGGGGSGRRGISSFTVGYRPGEQRGQAFVRFPGTNRPEVQMSRVSAIIPPDRPFEASYAGAARQSCKYLHRATLSRGRRPADGHFSRKIGGNVSEPFLNQPSSRLFVLAAHPRDGTGRAVGAALLRRPRDSIDRRSGRSNRLSIAGCWQCLRAKSTYPEGNRSHSSQFSSQIDGFGISNEKSFKHVPFQSTLYPIGWPTTERISLAIPTYGGGKVAIRPGFKFVYC